MEPSFAAAASPCDDHDDAGWDAHGFEIPSLDAGRRRKSGDSSTKSPHRASSGGTGENLYLGPHGTPPRQQQESASPSGGSGSGRKQRLKQKLKDAKKTGGTGTTLVGWTVSSQPNQNPNPRPHHISD